jgi:sn-glycerol 3-phosphate transport system permease protein
MEKSTVFNNRLLPYLLLLPQLAITVVFFYWPASQAIWQSFLREDAFGLRSEFVGIENYQALFAQPEYYAAILTFPRWLRRSRCRLRCCSPPRPTRT